MKDKTKAGGAGASINKPAKKQDNNVKNIKVEQKGHPTKARRAISQKKFLKVMKILGSLNVKHLLDIMGRIVFFLRRIMVGRQRSYMEAFAFSMLMTTITATALVGFGENGKWSMRNVTLKNETENLGNFAGGIGEHDNVKFHLPTDLCTEGIEVVKDCAVVDEAQHFISLGEEDCVVSNATLRISYVRCVRIKRGSFIRPVVQKSVNKNDGEVTNIIRSIERTASAWALAHPYFCGIVTIIIIMRMRTNLLMIALIMALIYLVNGTKAYDVNEAQVIQGKGRSLVTLPLNSFNTFHITTQYNYSIDVSFDSAHIGSSVQVRKLYQDCKIIKTTSANTCSGGTTLSPIPYVGGDKFCGTYSVQRGWGSSCFQFGPGQVQTCVTLSCSNVVKIHKFSKENVNIVGSIRIAGKKTPFSIVNGEYSMIDIGTYGVINMKATLNEKWLNSYVLINKTTEVILDLEDHVSNWLGVYSITGSKLMGLDRVITPKSVKADEVKFILTLPQFTPSGQEVHMTDNTLYISGGECQMNVVDVKPISVDNKCEVTALQATAQTESYAGLKMLTVNVKVSSAPCILVLDCLNTGCFTTVWSLNQVEQTILILVTTMDGINTIKAGDFSIKFEHKRSVIIDFYQSIKKEIVVASDAIEGNGFNLNFLTKLLHYQKTLLAVTVGMMFLLVGPTNVKIIGVGIIALAFLPTALSDVSCGYDSHDGMYCGTGLIIKDRHITSVSGDFDMNEPKIMEKFIHDAIDGYGDVNIVCASNLECQALLTIMRKIFGEKFEDKRYNKPIYPRMVGSIKKYSYGKKVYTVVLGNKMVRRNGNVVRLITTRDAQKVYQENNFWFPLRIVQHVRGWYSQLYVMDSMSDNDLIKRYCSNNRFSTGTKEGTFIATDEASYFESRENQFYYYENSQILYCAVNPNKILGEGVAESNLIIPRNIGGPVTHFNTLVGYSNQSSWDWSSPPYKVGLGTISGTKIIKDKNCKLSKMAYPTTKSSKWCCRTCTNGTALWQKQSGGKIFYAQEIQPLEDDAQEDEEFILVDEEEIGHQDFQ